MKMTELNIKDIDIMSAQTDASNLRDFRQKQTRVNNYKIYYVSTGRLQVVCKKTFKLVKAKCISKGNTKLKIIGSMPIKALNTINFESESFVGNIKKAYEMLLTLMSNVETVQSKMKREHVLPLLSLGLKFSRSFDKPITLLDFIVLLIDTYTVIYTTFPHLFSSEREFAAESSFETLLCGAVSMFLPNKLVEIIKRANLFSNNKLVDDFGGFHTIFTMIVDFIGDLCDKLPIPQKLREVVSSFLTFLNIGEHHRLISEAEAIIKIAQDSRSYLNNNFLQRVKDVQQRISNSVEINAWKARSPGIRLICTQLNDVFRIANNYSNASRQEPNLFVFEGPAGCGKSVLMNKIVQCLQDTTYIHTIKASMDGKDFYDSYNNQNNMVMDDLGQQGISQWRQTINFISCVICPLDCASAELKDTKFMNSRRIIVTTNNFMSLQGLSKQDCITELSALHRRGYVFDFKNITFKDGNYIGTLYFRRYNLNTSIFDNELPIGMKKFLQDKGAELNTSCTVTADNQEDLIVWILDVMNACDMMKNEQYNGAQLRVQDIERITERVRFKAEGLVLAKGILLATDGINATLGTPRAPAVGNQVVLNNNNNDDNDDANYNNRVPWFAQQPIRSWQSYFTHMTHNEEYTVKANYLRRVYYSTWFGEAISAFVEYFFLMYIVNLKTALFSGDIITIILTVMSLYGLLGILFNIGRSVINKTTGVVHNFFSNMTQASSSFEAQSRIYADMATNLSKTHTSTKSMIKSNAFIVELRADDVSHTVMGLLSGRSIIVPAHVAVKNTMVLTAYTADKQIVIDKHIVTRVYINNKDDIAIYNLSPSYPSPFPSLAKHFKDTTLVDNYASTSLVNCFGSIPIGDIAIKPEERISTSYKRVIDSYPDYINTFDKDKDLFYNVRFSGMCGTVAVDNNHGIIGMHVAGSSALGMGVSIVWSTQVKQDIRSILLGSTSWNIGLPLAEQKRPDESVIQIDYSGGVTLNKDSNIIPTELYGIYDPTRKPADLSKYGVGTTAEIFKKSTSPCNYIKLESINFAKDSIRQMLVPFDKLTEEETIKGSTEKNLAGMNKDSSNGYDYNLEKDKYIDFDNGTVLPPFREKLNNIQNMVTERNYPTGDMVYVECLKDELKPCGKDPRSFRIGTLGNQFLTKQYFGNLVAHIIQQRNFNMIQVGINPYTEWGKLYDRIESCSLKWAGDISKWDGKMSAQVQQSVVEVILEFVKDENKAMSEVLLSTLMNSLVLVANKTYLTTHSFPSGSFLTAIINSLVNRFYTALWYYESMKKNQLKPTLIDYFDNVVDFVYGDDKLNGVRGHETILNAITMRDFFESMGMTLTDSAKKPLTTPGQAWSDITFLKRSFEFHNKIKRVMCPLSKETLYTGIQYYDRSKDYNVVIRDKVNAFQREMYLHADYERELEQFVRKLQDRGFNMVMLPESTLLHLYTKEAEHAYKYGWGHQVDYI